MQPSQVDSIVTQEEDQTNGSPPPIAAPSCAHTPTSAEQLRGAEGEEEAGECWTDHGDSEEDDQWMPGRIRDIFLGSFFISQEQFLHQILHRDQFSYPGGR
jgi:hypothetical protein